MSMHTLRSLLFPAALVGCSLVSSCLIGSSSHTTVSGRYISDESLAKIEVGKSRDYVLAVLGEPSERTAIPDGTQIWKWRYSQRKETDTSVIFLIGAENETTTEHTTFVELKDDLVVKVWRD